MGTVTSALWSGYCCQLIEDIKSCHPEVKPSKFDNLLQSYDRSKIIIRIWNAYVCHQEFQNIQWEYK